MTEHRFGRVYNLRIAKNALQVKTKSEEKIENGTGGGGIKKPSVGDLLSLPPVQDVSAIKLDRLHIEAKIEYSKKHNSTASPAKISIYNLSLKTINTIKPESIIILEAGYKTDKKIPVIFAGQIVKIETARNGADKITTLLCNGAYTIQKNIRISKTYRKGITYKELIQELLKEAGAYGLPTGAFNTIPQQTPKDNKNTKDRLAIVLEDGYVVQGNLITELVRLVGGIGFKAYIVAGKIFIEPKEYPESFESYKITSDLIIGEVHPRINSAKTLSGSTEAIDGIKLTTFLDGRIGLNKKIDITSGEYKGVYDVEAISHNLSFEGQDWFTELDLTRIGTRE